MKDNLKPSRDTHSLGVEDMASRLAAAHGADIEKAAFAGRYHDIAKCFSDKKMNTFVWRDSNAEQKFVRYKNFMGKVFEGLTIEIEERK